MYIIGIDIGGTFTDSVAINDNGQVFVGKAPSTPQKLMTGVLNSLNQLAEKLGISLKKMLRETRTISHGTTVGTNALISRTGSRVGLIITRGFEDTIYIQRSVGRKAGLTDEEAKHQNILRQPQPLVAKSLIRGVTERIDCFGNIIFPLDEDEVREAVRRLVASGVEAIAVCLLWSFVNDVHEKRIRDIIGEMVPHVSVSISSEIAPKMRENARSNTTIINAYLDNIMSNYLSDFRFGLGHKGFERQITIMQAFGGVTSIAKKVKSVFTVGSGPVGAVVAAKNLGKLMGYQNLITTDVGGTSFDVSVIYNSQEIMAREAWGALGVMDRFEVLVPKVDIRSIGAGGGTIALIDKESGTIKVGPQSAGAEPGPICYNLGGEQPTVTDANVVLGYINPNNFWGGKLKLDREKAFIGIRENLAKPMNIEVEDVAAGIFEIINNKCADLIRGVVVGKGLDPRQFVLIIAGGAGPLHGSSYSRLVGVQKALIPYHAEVWSAIGIATSDMVHKYSATLIMPEPFDTVRIDETFDQLEHSAAEEMTDEGIKEAKIMLERSIDMRYHGQIHELTIPVPRNSLTTEQLAPLFMKEYEQIYGRGAAYTDRKIEILALNVSASAKGEKWAIELEKMPQPIQRRNAKDMVKGYREAYFRQLGRYVKTPIYDNSTIQVGHFIEGPAIIEDPLTTILILPEQVAWVDAYKNIVIEG